MNSLHGPLEGFRYFLKKNYSYFMPVCTIVKTFTLRWHGRPDALLHEAYGIK